MPWTDSSVEVTEKIHTIIDAAKGTYSPEIHRVYYGDTDLIPDFPSATVETADKARDLEGTHRFILNLSTIVTIYHGKVGGLEVTRKEVERLAEAVEDTLHGNKTLDGLVTFGYVTRIVHGVSPKPSAMLVATRIVWEGRSRVNFP